MPCGGENLAEGGRSKTYLQFGGFLAEYHWGKDEVTDLHPRKPQRMNLAP